MGNKPWVEGQPVRVGCLWFRVHGGGLGFGVVCSLVRKGNPVTNHPQCILNPKSRTNFQVGSYGHRSLLEGLHTL